MLINASIKYTHCASKQLVVDFSRRITKGQNYVKLEGRIRLAIGYHSLLISTLHFKNYTLFIFCNFLQYIIHEPIFIIFGCNICLRKFSTHFKFSTYFRTTPILCALTLHCNTTSESDYCLSEFLHT